MSLRLDDFREGDRYAVAFFTVALLERNGLLTDERRVILARQLLPSLDLSLEHERNLQSVLDGSRSLETLPDPTWIDPRAKLLVAERVVTSLVEVYGNPVPQDQRWMLEQTALTLGLDDLTMRRVIGEVEGRLGPGGAGAEWSARHAQVSEGAKDGSAHGFPAEEVLAVFLGLAGGLGCLAAGVEILKTEPSTLELLRDVATGFVEVSESLAEATAALDADALSAGASGAAMAADELGDLGIEMYGGSVEGGADWLLGFSVEEEWLVMFADLAEQLA